MSAIVSAPASFALDSSAVKSESVWPLLQKRLATETSLAPVKSMSNTSVL